MLIKIITQNRREDMKISWIGDNSINSGYEGKFENVRKFCWIEIQGPVTRGLSRGIPITLYSLG